LTNSKVEYNDPKHPGENGKKVKERKSYDRRI
jgi:hypothetical protein